MLRKTNGSSVCPRPFALSAFLNERERKERCAHANEDGDIILQGPEEVMVLKRRYGLGRQVGGDANLNRDPSRDDGRLGFGGEESGVAQTVGLEGEEVIQGVDLRRRLCAVDLS